MSRLNRARPAGARLFAGARAPLGVGAVHDDVVDLEDHLDDLRRELDLLLLADEGLEDLLLLHVVGALLEAVDAQVRVLLRELLGLDGRELRDRREARVLREGHGHVVERVGEGADGVLVLARGVVGGLGHGDGAGDLRRAAAVDDAVVLDEVPHDAHRVVEAALRLLDDHLVAAAHEDRDGLAGGAVLDDEHALFGGSERDLADAARLAELRLAQLGEARDDAAARSNRDELQLHAADPAHGRQPRLQEQVVRLVVEAPLADDHVRAAGLALRDHLREVVLLAGEELVVVLLGRDVELVLRLGLGRLEGARQDAHLRVLDLLGHLGVGDVLVDDDALDELRLLEAPAGLALHLDHVEVDVVAVDVRDGHDRVDGDLRHLPLVHVDDLRAQGRHGRLHEDLVVLGLVEGHGVRDVAQRFHRDLARGLEALGDAHGVEPLVQELLGLLQQRPGEHDDARRAVADLVVLGLRQLDQEPGHLVLDGHLVQDRRAVVRDRDVAVGAHHHLVHALGAQGRAQDVAHGPRGHDVVLLRLQALDAALLLLLLQDDEGPPVLVEDHRHGCGEGGAARDEHATRTRPRV
mmetsp:Transcript_27203/g.92600  ORF Transcript_27203/g.92600 Transcript_27203/m.92600 type:complete len:580 (+) Transcript_27203:51-1790(+)